MFALMLGLSTAVLRLRSEDACENMRLAGRQDPSLELDALFLALY